MSRGYEIKYEGLQRMRLRVQRASLLKLENVLAMSNETQTQLATEFFAGGMTSRLTAVLAGETISIPAIMYPKDWIEAIKDRFLPQWLRRWWPVYYHYVVWDASVLYPKISLPDEEHWIAEVRTTIREVSKP